MYALWYAADDCDVTESQISVSNLPKSRLSRRSNLPTKCSKRSTTITQVMIFFINLTFSLIVVEKNVELHYTQTKVFFVV